MRTTDPTFSPKTQNDSSPSGAGRLYTNQYLWTADFIKQKRALQTKLPHSLVDVRDLRSTSPWLFSKSMTQKLKGQRVQHMSNPLKPLPISQAATLADLNNMHIAHRRHLVGLGSH